jgi:hypothetical protein
MACEPTFPRNRHPRGARGVFCCAWPCSVPRSTTVHHRDRRQRASCRCAWLCRADPDPRFCLERYSAARRRVSIPRVERPVRESLHSGSPRYRRTEHDSVAFGPSARRVRGEILWALIGFGLDNTTYELPAAVRSNEMHANELTRHRQRATRVESASQFQLHPLVRLCEHPCAEVRSGHFAVLVRKA